MVCSTATGTAASRPPCGCAGTCRPALSTRPGQLLAQWQRLHHGHCSLPAPPGAPIAGYLLLEGVATGSGWLAALADVGRVERIAAVEMPKKCLESSDEISLPCSSPPPAWTTLTSDVVVGAPVTGTSSLGSRRSGRSRHAHSRRWRVRSK